MKRSPMPQRKARILTRRSLRQVSKKRSAEDRVWQATRQRVLVRDGGRCRRCNGHGNHVHHVLPRSRGGRNDGRTPLLTLCFKCHGYVHDHPMESKEKGWLA